VAAIKNNVTRMLEAQGIPFQAHELPGRKVGALEAADILGVPADLVYKTIVASSAEGGKPLLAVVPGPKEVEPKALARVLGVKKVQVTSQREAEQITGLPAGGISPLALMQKGFRVVLDESALEHEVIIVSGGQWGLNVSLAVKDFVALTHAKLASISR